MGVTCKVCVCEDCLTKAEIVPRPGYKVIWLYDGCPSNDASNHIKSYDDAKGFIKNAQKYYHSALAEDPKLELGIVDLSTGRLMSHVL